jgi:two-component sensor histidine kinase
LHTVRNERKNGNMIFKKIWQLYARNITLTYFLVLCGHVMLAQTPNIVTLKARLQKSKPDTARTTLLLQLSNYYNNLPKPLPDLTKALAYAGAAEKLSITLIDNRGLGNSYLALAKAWRNNKDSTKANAYLRLAKNTFVTNGLPREAAEAVLNMEEFYQYFGGTDLNVRIAYYEQALPLFTRAGARQRQAATLKVLADFYQLQGKYGKALSNLKQALELNKSTDLPELEGLYDLLGSVYSVSGDLNEALKYGLLAIKTAELLKDSSLLLCTIYNRVGLTYFKMKQYDRAQDLFKRSLAIAIKYNDKPSIITLSVNLVKILITYRKYADAIVLLKNIETKYADFGDLSFKAGIDFHLLKCYTMLKQFDIAEIYCKRLLLVSSQLDQKDNNQEAYQLTLTAYYVATVQDLPARMHLRKFKALAVAHHNRLNLSTAYFDEAHLDSAEGKYASALKNYHRYSVLKDSIYNETQSKQIAQLQIQFETEKKDQQLIVKEDRIKLLNNQAYLQQISLNQEKTTQKLIIGGAILLVILLGLSYNGYRLKRRINKQLETQRAEIEQKNVSLINLVQDKDNLLDEKEWLMKEIHHRVKNNLQIVISLLSTQSNYLDNDIAYNAIRESQHRMQSISLIHQKLYQSENLALVDINSYIADLVAYLRDSFDTGSRIVFEMDIVQAELDVTRAVPLGLILNEAITNSIKYAFPDNRSGKISISLKATAENSFILTIHDDGVGLPPTADLSKSKSLGMSLMRGLSKQLGGSLKVESSDGITVAVDFVTENLLKTV